MFARAIWLEHGKMIMDDRSTNVTAAYYRRVLEEDTRQHTVHQAESDADTRRYGTGEVTLSRVEFLDDQLQLRPSFVTGEPMVMRLHYEAHVPVHDPVFGVAVYRSDNGVQMTGPNSMFDGCTLPTIHGVGYVDYRIDRIPWLPGEFDLHAAIVNREDSVMYDYWFECARFVVAPGGTRDRAGLMALGGHWQVG